MKIVTVANQKGGCGKTTTSVGLGAGFALFGRRTCVIDLDAQCNLTSIFGIDLDAHSREGGYTAVDIYVSRLSARQVALSQDYGPSSFGIVPGHGAMNHVYAKLESEVKSALIEGDQSPLDEDDMRAEQRERLRRSVATLEPFFDYVVIDTPPQLGFLLTTALIASDYCIVPVLPSAFDLDGLGKLTTTVRKIQERANPKLELLGVLLNRVEKRTKLDQQVYDMLAERFGKRCFKTQITSSVKHREATVSHTTIYEHAPGHPASNQYLDLTEEVLRNIEGETAVLDRAAVDELLLSAQFASAENEDGVEPTEMSAEA